MERLTTKVDNLYQTNDKFKPLLGIKRLGEYEDTGLTPEEIENLKIELESMRSAANSLKMHYKKAKSEAIKEFAEELKLRIIDDTAYGCDCNQHSGYYDYTIKIGDIPEYIDDLVKEMTEEKNNG